jgi:hypothetical protein
VLPQTETRINAWNRYVSCPRPPVVAAHDLRGLHEHCIEAEILGCRHTVGYATTKDPTTKECYNEGMLQRRILQRRNAATKNPTTKECYNEGSYNEGMLQRTQILQRTRRNTIDRRSTRVPMTCRAFPLWLEDQSSSLLAFVRFSYQFSSVIWLFAPLGVKIYIFKLFCYLILTTSRQNRVRKLEGNFAVGCGPRTDYL